MTRVKYEKSYSRQYRSIVGRFIRQAEKEVMGVLRTHPTIPLNMAWDIVSKAQREADKIVTGGYPVE